LELLVERSSGRKRYGNRIGRRFTKLAATIRFANFYGLRRWQTGMSNVFAFRESTGCSVSEYGVVIKAGFNDRKIPVRC